MYKALGPQTTAEPKEVAVDIQDQIFPLVINIFAENNETFKQSKGCYVWNGSNKAFKKLCPEAYRKYQDGLYTYYPINVIIKYSEKWVKQRFRLVFNTISKDCYGNIVNIGNKAKRK